MLLKHPVSQCRCVCSASPLACSGAAALRIQACNRNNLGEYVIVMVSAVHRLLPVQVSDSSFFLQVLLPFVRVALVAEDHDDSADAGSVPAVALHRASVVPLVDLFLKDLQAHVQQV